MADIEDIIDNFSILDDWDDRYRYLIELGRELPPLDEAAHSDANKVQGCASQVWLDTSVRPNGAGGPVLTFAGDSDAHIVRGLIAILFAMYSGKSATRHSCDRRSRAVREDGLARASDAAAVERLPLDGGADSLGCPHRARGHRFIAERQRRPSVVPLGAPIVGYLNPGHIGHRVVSLVRVAGIHR